ncbi:hypothetical protein ANCDUO_08357 [Ancylostoma duodenale]|uniref:Uncharacterized protein n=1 Tax=Ancylostoma duodenale TaxID=51022 RepID=A0A0C2GWB2_9BILA|nr:hypothetical protein ANCDUO_08357 [Ancylostoma duodenale]
MWIVGEMVSRLSSDCQIMAATKLSTETQAIIAKANNKAAEALGCMRTVRALATMGYNWNNEIKVHGTLVAVLVYGGHLVMTGRMTSANLITFIFYQRQLDYYIYWLAFEVAGIMDCVGASRKVM